MAFRKKFRFKRSRAPSRRPFKRFARQKFDVVELYNTPFNSVFPDGNPGQKCGPFSKNNCGFQDNPQPCDDGSSGSLPSCCLNISTFPLVSQRSQFTNPASSQVELTGLQNYFEDNVTIVRLFGDLYFQNRLAMPQDSDLCLPLTRPTLAQYADRYAEAWFWGLRKWNATQGDFPSSQMQFSNQDVATPCDSYPWTEAKWLWHANKIWMPTRRRGTNRKTQGSTVGVCSDTSGGFAFNALDLGTGNIDTAISTECNIVQGPEEGGCLELWNYEEANLPPLHHVRFSVKRHITLRRDDVLNLQCGMKHFGAGGQAAPEVGWGCSDVYTNEYSLSKFQLRIAAVVRLN